MPVTDLGVLGKVLAPETLSDLTICPRIAATFGVVAWRGQSDGAWPVTSTLARRLQGPAKIIGRNFDEATALEVGLRLIERARLLGHGHAEGRRLSDLEVLARLRHHGAATRILDCSRNAYVAAWFAAMHHPDRPGAVVGFGMRDYVPVNTEKLVDTPLEPLLRDGIGDRVGVWQPTGLTPRLAAQDGLFLLGQLADEPWGTLPLRGEALEHAGAVPESVVIAVEPDLKRELVDQLVSVHGLTDERLFPDLDGFSSAHSWSARFPADFFVGGDS